jgi:hypothetical protein
MVKYLFLVLILVVYLLFVSYKFGTKEGFFITFLTWSFFVFCTPIADAGFILDFPIRLVTGIRMFYSEVVVWILAAVLNVVALTYFPAAYQTTFVLKLFYVILTNPYPYWGIIILSMLGTFFSIYFGDELWDVARHKEREKYHKHILKYELILYVFILAIIFALYHILLGTLNITI